MPPTLSEVLMNNLMPPRHDKPNKIHKKLDNAENAVREGRREQDSGNTLSETPVSTGTVSEQKSSGTPDRLLPSSLRSGTGTIAGGGKEPNEDDDREPQVPLAQTLSGLFDQKTEEAEKVQAERNEWLEEQGLSPSFVADNAAGYTADNASMINSVQPNADDDFLSDVPGMLAQAPKFFDPGNKDGFFNFDNWPILGSSPREKAMRAEQEQYKTDNPMPEGAMELRDGHTLTSPEYAKKYQEYFANQGGLEEGYSTGIADLTRSGLENGILPDLNAIPGALDKISHENYDDGTMRADSVKGKYMSGKQYKEYAKAGFGGRPIDQIDDNASYNKLDEMEKYNFIPYIEDAGQAAGWNITQLGDNITKPYEQFVKLRSRYNEPTVTYDGKTFNRNDLLSQMEAYSNKVNKGKEITVAPDDPRAVRYVRDVYEIETPDGGVKTYGVDEIPEMEAKYTGNGHEIKVSFPGTDIPPIMYPNEEAYNNGVRRGSVEVDDPSFASYAKGLDVDPTMHYKGYDGTEYDLTMRDVIKMQNLMSNGEMPTNYGPFNMAKDTNERKGYWDMLTSLDFSDFVPTTIDLLTGSAPLFLPQTAWPQAIGNALTAVNGIDPHSYDPNTGTWKRAAGENPDTGEDLMNGMKFATNIGLNLGTPFLERIAGNIGGTASPFWRPVMKAMEGKPIAARWGVDALGEGAEEVVADLWENLQGNDWQGYFASPVFDEDGNPVLDTSGHQILDTSTPLPERGGNAVGQIPDNLIGGALLGGTMGGLSLLPQYATRTGEFENYDERKARRKWEKKNDFARYVPAEHDDEQRQIITEDSIGGHYWDSRRKKGSE